MIRKLHILNLGGGVDSVAIITRWIMDPASRPFESFRDLVVIMAQTGDEMPETKALIETYLLPLMRQYGIRFIQVCRAGQYKKDGIVVLDDSTEPTTFHAEIESKGGFPLSKGWKLSGSSQRVSRPHICAQRHKGEVLDALLDAFFRMRQTTVFTTALLMLKDLQQLILKGGDDLSEGLLSCVLRVAMELLGISGSRPIFGPYLGYAKGEEKRSAKSDGYGCRNVDYVYPLQQWGWDRQQCIDFLFQVFGVIWRKSACKGCVFLSEPEAIARYFRDPQAGAETALIEANTLAFNPRLHHFGHGTAIALLRDSGNTEAVELFEQLLEQTGYGVYHLKRIYRQLLSKTSGKWRKDAERWTKRLAVGTREEMIAFLHQLAQEHSKAVVEDGGLKVYLRVRSEKSFPTAEEFFCLAPNLAQEEKCRNPKMFPIRWADVTSPVKLEQLSLLPTPSRDSAIAPKKRTSKPRKHTRHATSAKASRLEPVAAPAGASVPELEHRHHELAKQSPRQRLASSGAYEQLRLAGD